MQKNSVLLGVVEAFFVGEILFCFFWVLFFFVQGIRGEAGFGVFLSGVFFLLKGGNPKNVCFKRDLHLDAMFVFFSSSE